MPKGRGVSLLSKLFAIPRGGCPLVPRRGKKVKSAYRDPQRNARWHSALWLAQGKPQAGYRYSLHFGCHKGSLSNGTSRAL